MVGVPGSRSLNCMSPLLRGAQYLSHLLFSIRVESIYLQSKSAPLSITTTPHNVTQRNRNALRPRSGPGTRSAHIGAGLRQRDRQGEAPPSDPRTRDKRSCPPMADGADGRRLSYLCEAGLLGRQQWAHQSQGCALLCRCPNHVLLILMRDQTPFSQTPSGSTPMACTLACSSCRIWST